MPQTKSKDLFFPRYIEAGVLFSLFFLFAFSIDKQFQTEIGSGKYIVLLIIFFIGFFGGYFFVILINAGVKFGLAAMGMIFGLIGMGVVGSACEKIWSLMSSSAMQINDAILKLVVTDKMTNAVQKRWVEFKYKPFTTKILYFFIFLACLLVFFVVMQYVSNWIATKYLIPALSQS